MPCKILSGSVYCEALERQKKLKKNWPHFQIQHFAVAPLSGVETKANTNPQVHILPYPMPSKSSLSSNGFNGEVAFINFTVQKRDRQTKKTSNFFAVGDARSPKFRTSSYSAR